MDDRFDPEIIALAFELILNPGNLTELRILNGNVGGRRVTLGGYFDAAGPLIEAVEHVETASGFYITPNPVNPDLQSRSHNQLTVMGRNGATQDADILQRRWLLIDCDAQRETNTSATDAEHEAAQNLARDIYKHLHGLDWPDPIAADSGNGAHLMYRINLPTDDGGLVKCCLEQLHGFSDDVVKVDRTVHNPARIWKLYGTPARKGLNTKDRPHRMARILSFPDELMAVPTELLEKLAPATSKATPCINLDKTFKYDVEAFLQRNRLDVTGPAPYSNGPGGSGRKWVFHTCPWNNEHNRGEAFIIEYDSRIIAAGCHHDSCTWGWRDLRSKYEEVPPRPTSTSDAERPVPQVDPYTLFPVELLPEPMRNFVMVCANAMTCDPSYVALPLISAVASVIGNTRTIQLKPGWTEPAVVWTAVVGESGTKKSPPFRQAIKAVRELEKYELGEYQDRLALYEKKKKEYAKALSLWKKDKKDTSDPPEEPKEPRPARLIVSDVTIEALSIVLNENPNGVLMCRDELSGWLASFDRYTAGRGGSDVSSWLSMFNAESLVVDRKTGIRRICVDHAAVSVCGTIQPGVLAKSVSDEHRENGLLARLLLAMPDRRLHKWTDANIPHQVDAEMGCLFDELRALRPDESQQPVPLRMTPEAKAVWVTFYNEHAEQQFELVGDLAAAWSKLEGYAARLGLLVHQVRQAAKDPTLAAPDLPDLPGAVDQESIRIGIELSRWFGNEAKRTYAVLAETEQAREERRLLEWIEHHSEGVSIRDMTHGPVQFRKDPEAAQAALDELAKAGLGNWVYPKPGPKGGRPTARFQITRRNAQNQNPT